MFEILTVEDKIFLGFLVKNIKCYNNDVVRIRRSSENYMCIDVFLRDIIIFSGDTLFKMIDDLIKNEYPQIEGITVFTHAPSLNNIIESDDLQEFNIFYRWVIDLSKKYTVIYNFISEGPKIYNSFAGTGRFRVYTLSFDSLYVNPLLSEILCDFLTRNKNYYIQLKIDFNEILFRENMSKPDDILFDLYYNQGVTFEVYTGGYIDDKVSNDLKSNRLLCALLLCKIKRLNSPLHKLPTEIFKLIKTCLV